MLADKAESPCFSSESIMYARENRRLGMLIGGVIERLEVILMDLFDKPFYAPLRNVLGGIAQDILNGVTDVK